MDMLFLTRFNDFVMQCLPRNVVQALGEYKLNSRFDHEIYGLKPDHYIDAQHPMVSDELPNRIACGSIIVKPDVKCIIETGVEFVDGTKEYNIDTIVTATGYVFGFPYLEKDVIKVQNNFVDLYKNVFPPNLSCPTLAVIGCIQPLGALNPIAEMQARWATRVFKVLGLIDDYSKYYFNVLFIVFAKFLCVVIVIHYLFV